MPKTYSQFRAFLALTKGSLQSMLKSPSALFFSIAFPLIFIVAFGLMSDGGISVNVALDKNSDTLNPIYYVLKNNSILAVKRYEEEAKKLDELKKGRIAGIINIQANDSNAKTPYQIVLQTSIAGGNDRMVVKQILNGILDTLNKGIYKENKQLATIQEPMPIEGRPYKYLDFFLPGMLGFSLLSAGIFGTAFVFFTLRQTLVLKRFYATPVKRVHIILSEGISRLIMQILSASIIILVGHFAFGFTLVHGFSTFIQMLLLAAYGLILFLGMGFVISSLAKNEAMIPPLANTITMPQLLLSGVFLSVTNFPEWLQPLCKALPLTQFNSAMRSIAFEGKSLLDLWMPLGILTIWIIMIYAVAVKVFRWE